MFFSRYMYTVLCKLPQQPPALIDNGIIALSKWDPAQGICFNNILFLNWSQVVFQLVMFSVKSCNPWCPQYNLPHTMDVITPQAQLRERKIVYPW